MNPCFNWFIILIYQRGQPAAYIKSISNSTIEMARTKSLDDGVVPVSIVRIDCYYHVKIESNIPGQATIFRCSNPIIAESVVDSAGVFNGWPSEFIFTR
jgi:hypothetical protein